MMGLWVNSGVADVEPLPFLATGAPHVSPLPQTERSCRDALSPMVVKFDPTLSAFEMRDSRAQDPFASLLPWLTTSVLSLPQSETSLRIGAVPCPPAFHPSTWSLPSTVGPLNPSPSKTAAPRGTGGPPSRLLSPRMPAPGSLRRALFRTRSETDR